MTRWHLPLLALCATTARADPPKRSAPNPPPVPGGYSGLGAESLSPQEIAKYAPPPLDECTSRKIQSMLDVRGTGAGFITSKGDRQIYSSWITGIAQVWRQDGPLKYPVELTGGEDLTVPVAIAPDDSFVVVSRDIGGQQNPGLYLLSPDGGQLKLVHHTPKVQAELQYISDNSKFLYIRANDRDPAAYVVYRYDIANNTREPVFDKEGLWQIVDHRGDATWLLVKSLGSAQRIRSEGKKAHASPWSG